MRGAGSAGRRRRSVVLGVVLALALVAVVAVVGVAGVRWWTDRHRTDLQRAVAYAPSDSVRFSWTDWSAVRHRLGADLDRGSTAAQVQKFLDRGYDADLTSSSAMIDSMPELQGQYGFSPATVDWELLAQGTQGSVLIIGLPDSLGVDALGDSLTRLGYSPPSGSDKGSGGSGVYLGDDELLSRITVDSGLNLSPQYTDIALDADRHVLLASDNGPYLRQAYAGLGEQHRAGGEGTTEVVDAVDDPLSAELYSGAYACKFLAMGQADEQDEEAGKQLIEQAGGVDPLDGFAMANEPDHTVLVALSFDSGDEARHNADSRAALAGGPAPGQGGDFTDRFRLGDVSAHDKVVTMQLTPRTDRAVVSDLSSGPVLFASC